MFKIGQKVVCVDASGLDLSYGENGPQFGEIYTIRDFYIDGTSVYLNEIVNKKHLYNVGFLEACFLLTRFRPLDETFAEETLKNIAEQIEQEQLVLI